MSKIIRLNKILANQIAAGEVVERPFSVVKELVENSIDAGAKNIKIEIIAGGTKKISITDDGKGIEKEDLSIVLEKYTTSKIKTIKDLHNIMTFGFRGEALSSISSVSDIEIITKTADDKFGSILISKGGQIEAIKEYPSEIGTKIIVKNLFHNTPARLNYLKTERTEYSHILNFLNNISLAYPEIGFEFISDDKKIFNYKLDEVLKTRIYNIYGEEFATNLIGVNFGTEGMKITGYISDPKVSFANRNKQNIFVNKRGIKSPLIYKAISNGYNRFIPHSSFPGYILNLEIDPTLCDVNVHPRKQEIRFAEEQNIFKLFHSAVSQKLDSVSLITTQTPNLSENYFRPGKETPSKINTEPKYHISSGKKDYSYSPYKEIKENPAQEKIHDAINFSKTFLESTTSNEIKTSDLHFTPIGKIIGQTFNSYIVVETNNSIKILDQHALAERVIYEKLVSGNESNKTQKLLISENINLTALEFGIFEENKNSFEEVGFEVEILSGTNIMINGIPDFTKKEDIKNVFTGILEDLGEHKNNNSKTLQEIKNKVFAYTACRSAIKFGQKLNLFEMNKLLNDASIDYAATCPHGRPVIFEIDKYELRGKYER